MTHKKGWSFRVVSYKCVLLYSLYGTIGIHIIGLCRSGKLYTYFCQKPVKNRGTKMVSSVRNVCCYFSCYYYPVAVVLAEWVAWFVPFHA